MFTNWKAKYLALETRLRVEVIPNVDKLECGVELLKQDRDAIKVSLARISKELEGERHRIKCLAQELSNENTVCNVLRKDNKDKEAQIIELTETVEVLKTELRSQQELYDVDTHNLLLQIAALDPGTMSKAEPTPEVKPQLVQVTEDFFGKLAAELTTQWQKATTQTNLDGAAHGKVSDRLGAVQQPRTHKDNVSDFFAQPTTQPSNSGAGKVNMPTALPKPAPLYIPSPDFAASFDEGTTQVDGQSVATGLSITQPATGPIKLPSQMVAEFEAPYNPE